MDATVVQGGRGSIRRRRVLLTLLAASAATGCSLLRPAPDSPFEGPSRPSQIRIEVLNNNFSDATLHAFRGAERQRLGIVTGKTAATYHVPWPISQSLAFEISLLAGRSCRTGVLQVDPGSVVEVQIAVEGFRGGQCHGMRAR